MPEPEPTPIEEAAVEPAIPEAVEPTPSPEEEPTVKPEPTPAAKPGLNKAVIIAAVVIGILVIGLIGYFVFRGPVEEIPTEEPTAELPTVEEEIPEEFPISIDNLLFAKTIAEDFSYYIKRTNSTYKKEEIVQLYHEVHNIKPVSIEGKYQIGFIEIHELFDPDNQLIAFVSEENTYSTTRTIETSDYHTIDLRSSVDTSRLTKPGTYTYRITLTDEFNPNNKAVEEIQFILE